MDLRAMFGVWVSLLKRRFKAGNRLLRTGKDQKHAKPAPPPLRKSKAGGGSAKRGKIGRVERKGKI